ncbi:MAG TPA: tRNA (adenosine(37)-N6)-threonylcarbamoyltransferase complex dimerization subunit type 1 TsaB [Polyangiales bacterium]|nr:tRNA (adenosine(37)-N6)-threonylcarbamoyltransferase complex dimerization subunit type 1 TsaB [Polyangiales bacterium]
MRVLAMDTSTFVGTVAVLRDGALLAEWSASVRATHGETLLPHVARALEQAGVPARELDLIAVGIGPGSFTGTRIGVATAKGLALAEGKPLLGLCSLRVIAGGMPEGALRAIAVDAQKGELYCALYAYGPEGLEERIAPFHALPAEAAARLGAFGPVVLAGDGAERYPDFSAGLSFTRAPRLCDVPRAAVLAHEAARAFAGDGPSDLASLEPLYVRPSDAKLPAGGT